MTLSRWIVTLGALAALAGLLVAPFAGGGAPVWQGAAALRDAATGAIPPTTPGLAALAAAAAAALACVVLAAKPLVARWLGLAGLVATTLVGGSASADAAVSALSGAPGLGYGIALTGFLAVFVGTRLAPGCGPIG